MRLDHCLCRFWHEFPQLQPISLDDVEHHCFFDTELMPSTLLHDCKPAVQSLVAHMILHRDRFLAAAQGDAELSSFWIRKTKKPVSSAMQ